MKCERCGKATDAYELFDYCAVCSKNLCPTCLRDGRCAPTRNERGGHHHVPANHGGEG